MAEAYLEYLYTPEGQEIAARNYYRPRLESVAAKFASTFPKIKLFTVDEVFGGWQEAQKTHFADGGVFDQIYQPGDRRRWLIAFTTRSDAAGIRAGAGLHRACI